MFYRCIGGSRTAATSKMERFVIKINGFQPLTIDCPTVSFGPLLGGQCHSPHANHHVLPIFGKVASGFS